MGERAALKVLSPPTHMEATNTLLPLIGVASIRGPKLWVILGLKFVDMGQEKEVNPSGFLSFSSKRGTQDPESPRKQRGHRNLASMG